MSKSEPTITVKTALDMNIVGENILDIAEYAIERHEFTTGTTLAPEEREEAVRQIRDALWKLVERFRARREQWLGKLFSTADRIVKDVAGGS